ncbi:MAG: class I SAM-dependent methyltransferase [Bacteroidales bacterium]|nr:class I SAM-dependent methyltransferase [Bacteroidales bacterium]
MTVEYFIKSVLKPFAIMLYWYISKKDQLGEVKFLNYGFDDGTKIELSKNDETERYPLQLYHHVVSAIEINQLDILEVGCGRGGGSSYIARYFKPKSIKAVDISGKAIDYCRKNHIFPTCEFIKADAQKLPFNDKTFDVVLNIESSLYYPDVEKFFNEVYRVLRPNGYFLYADFRYRINIASLKEKVKTSKFQIIRSENITKEVVKALETDHERRVDLIKKLAPRLITALVSDFAGVKRFNTYKAFAKGKWEYYFYVLKKN